MSTDSHVDDDIEDDASDIGDGKVSKLRSSNEITEICNVVLTLTINEVMSQHGGLTIDAQKNLMKPLADQWISLLSSEFAEISRRMKKEKITTEMLRKMVNVDSGKSMHRKAKEVVAYIVNHLTPSWVEPVCSESGKGKDGMRPIYSKCSTINSAKTR